MSWNSIRPTVRGGQVVLEGTVDWQFVKERAEELIRKFRGVTEVRNSIRVQPKIVVQDIHSRIEAPR